MNWWRERRHYLDRARQWESPNSLDPEIRELKRIFRTTSQHDDKEIGERVWKRMRPYMKPLEAPVTYASSLWSALASTGPRFALGGALAFTIMASLFLTQPQMNSAIETASLGSLSILEGSVGNPGEDPLEIVQVNNGDELLRFIAYENLPR